jgi:hypothetical protein
MIVGDGHVRKLSRGRDVLVVPAEIECMRWRRRKEIIRWHTWYLTCPQFLDVGREGMGNRRWRSRMCDHVSR